MAPVSKWTDDLAARATIPREVDEPADAPWIRAISGMEQLCLGQIHEESHDISDDALAWARSKCSPATDVLSCEAEADLDSLLTRWISGLTRSINNRSEEKHSLRAVFIDFPMLARFVGTLCVQWLEVRSEFVDRLRADQRGLAEAFNDNRSTGKAVCLQAGISDRHSGGRTVISVTFSCGQKIIYKPRDGRPEAAFYDLLSWLDRAGLRPRSGTLRSLVRPTHGWFEFATKNDPSDAEAESLFWKRTGVLICILDLLEARDCHRENLIFAGNKPILVDAEALFHQPIDPPQHSNDDDSLSVIRTGLTPYWKSHEAGRIESGGAGCPPPERIEDIIDGFRNTCEFIMKNRQALLKQDGPLSAFEQLEFRTIYRNTSFYQQLLIDSCQAEFLDCGEKWITALEPLRLESLNGQMDEVMRCEEKALLQMDIPRFTTNAGDTFLALDANTKIYGWFDISGIERTRRKIEVLSDEWMEGRTRVLRSAYALAAVDSAMRRRDSNQM